MNLFNLGVISFSATPLYTPPLILFFLSVTPKLAAKAAATQSRLAARGPGTKGPATRLRNHVVSLS